MTKHLDQQWTDIHRADPYPFKDTASLRSVTGELEIDRRWFIEARLWPVTSSSRVYLRTIARSGTLVTLTIASESSVLATATVNANQDRRRAVFYDSGSNQIGFLQTSAGGWKFILDYPEGTYRFGVSATEFIPTVVTPQVRGGASVIRDDAGNFLTGAWRFVGGEGVELVKESNQLRINFIGDELYRRDTCENPEELGLLMHPVRAIHWTDLSTGVTGIVRPKRGRIVSAVIDSSESDPRNRGHQSPGPGKVLVEQMS